MQPISLLEPKALWSFFEDLCGIPRPSKHETKVIDFVVEFAKAAGLQYIKDEVGNVIIRKPATKGMENRKGVVLQSHLDMVPQKNADKVHDFKTDPIEAYLDGEWVTAKGTTLGADNGIGVAAILAVLASENIPHPNLEALLTVDEETGMTGAFGLKPDLLQGNILFNLDSEDEGELYIGCAGGVNCTANFTYTGEELPEGFSTYKIAVTGFRGGHSGLDIHLGRGNANKSMNRILWNLHQTCGMRLSTLKGGSLRNAIPRESFAWVAIPNTQTGKMEELLKRLHSEISEELKFTEPDFKLEYTESPLKDNLLEADTALALYRAIYACPNGPIRMNDQIPTLTETSTNLAIVTVKKGNIIAKSLLRSFVDSAKIELQHAVESVFLLAGATVVSDGEYPGWRPNPNSEILELLGALYKSKWNIQPQVKAIHAGLECGILGAAYPNWDMISFGPTIRYPHSPDEKVNVASVAKFWDFLLAALNATPQA